MFKYLKEHRPISTAVLFTLVVDLADIVTSQMCSGWGGQYLHESNPFARDENYNFLLGRGLIMKAIFFFAWSLLAAVVYEALAHSKPVFARTVVALLFCIPAVIVLPIAINNFLLFLRWFTP